MKNKKFMYLLITAVTGVWGIIFYKIYAAGHEKDAVQAVTMIKKIDNEPLDDYKLKDTYTLALNYGDPMLGEVATDAKPLVTIPETIVQQPATFIVPKPVSNPDIIKYTGYILNASGKRMAAIINLNGKELMLSEGEKASELRIIKNYKDSIKITYKNQTKYIRLE